MVIQNPHQNLEDRLERQRDVLEKLLGDLAARLERDRSVAPPLAAGASEAAAADERLAALAAEHEAEEAHLALLGRLLDEDRREAVLGKTLRAALAGIADRLEHLLRDEAKALAALKARPAAGAPGWRPRRRSRWPSWRATCCGSTI